MTIKNIAIRFNKILISLLSQLSDLIGVKYYNKIKRISKINYLLPLKYSVKFFNNYQEKIMNKDELFFLNEELNKSSLNDDSLNEILKLKKIYYKIDNQSKENLWLNLQALTLLSNDYYCLAY
tara:strand:- start:676 stop:1044 length:369 start_codon:yes stop_codon:yes gene_type:complete